MTPHHAAPTLDREPSQSEVILAQFNQVTYGRSMNLHGEYLMNTTPLWTHQGSSMHNFSLKVEVNKNQEDNLDIVTLLEEKAGPLFEHDPIRQGMINDFGHCPPEVKKSLIENLDGVNLYHKAVWDVYDYNLNMVGATFYEPMVDNEIKDWQSGGGNFFNQSKLNTSPLIVTEDVLIAFKTGFPVYQLNRITPNGLQQLQHNAQQVYFVTALHELENYKRRFRDVEVKILALGIPPDISTTQEELDAEIQNLITKNETSSFDEIIPLNNEQNDVVDDYPIHAFPPIVANAIKKSAHYHKVPLAVAGQTYLGELAYIAQSHINAPSDKSSKGQPCSLFTLTIFPSGEGKDNCINDACKISVELNDRDMQLYEAEKATWRAAKVKEKGEPPKAPLSIFKKLSTQGLVGMISKSSKNSFTWTTGEGGYLFGGYSMNSDTIGESLSVLNELLDTGKANNVLKGLDDVEYVTNARFSLNIAVQDVVARPALHNKLLREQGFLARCLFTAPEPLSNVVITKKDRTLKPYDDPDLKAYWELCDKLMGGVPKILDSPDCHSRKLIVKDDAADDLHIQYENMIRVASQKSGKYHIIQAYAKRTNQYVLRVAAILAFLENSDVIDARLMRNAIALCQFSLDEWIRYYGKAPLSKSETLLKWLLAEFKKGNKKILKSSILQTGPDETRNAKARDAALEHLIDTNHVMIEKLGAKAYVVLNPNISMA